MSLATVPTLRLVRSRQAWLSVAGWTAFLLLSVLVQRRHGAPHLVDHALDLYASFAVPFLVNGLAGVAVAQMGLAGSGRSLVTLGASKARTAFATIVVAMAASALVAGLLGAIVVVVAHGPDGPPLATDLRLTAGFGALAGAAYAAYFLVGASFIGGIWGRGIFFVLDWVLGSDEGFGALLTPRAHLRNLLGGEGPFETLPWESMVALALLIVVFTAFAVRRASRAHV